MRSAALLLIALLVGGTPLQQRNGQVEGVVLRSDNQQPIDHVRVVLVGSGPGPASGYTTWSGPDGRFALKDVTPGSYRLTASQDGFGGVQHGQKKPGAPGTTLEVSESRPQGGLTLVMTPESTISGKVYDETGRPLARARIQLLQRQYTPSGRLIAQLVAGDSTNDRGEYRIFWVTPGMYYVAATATTNELTNFRELNDQPKNLGMFLPTFFPGSLSADRAEPVNLAPGIEVRGIDFAMTRFPTARLAGTLVDGTTGRPLTGAAITLQPSPPDWAELAMIPGATTTTNGQFTLGKVPSGTYTISAVTAGVNGIRMSNASELRVGDKDLTDLNVVVNASPSIRGRIVAEPGTPPTQIGSLSFEAVGGGVDSGAAVEADGNFVAANLSSGIYRISLNAREGYFIRSARSGSRNVLLEGLDTRPATLDPLEVTIAFTSAQVEGVVLNLDDKPARDTQVVLIPNTDRALRTELFLNVTTNPDGRFTLRGVAPGNYKLFAWDEIEPYQYFDAAFMELYESRGTPVHVELNANVNVSLRKLP